MKRSAAGRSYWSLVFQQFKRDRLAMLGLAIVLLLFLMALLQGVLANDRPLIMKKDGALSFPAFFFKPEYRGMNFRNIAKSLKGEDFAVFAPAPYSPTEYDLAASLQPPSKEHWLGTDDRGRDVLSRLVHGARVSLSVGFVAVGLYIAIGVFFGALAGYYGGMTDVVISRLIEVMICFPTFFLIITIVAFLQPSLYNIMIAIGVTRWTGAARLVRGEFLKLRQIEFVEATRAMGASDMRTIFKHVLPNAIAPVLVVATFGVADAILIESSLSFLGFGVAPPTPSWGDILSQSRSYYDFAWWLTIFPGLAIFITITAYNLVGEGIRDAIDPRLKDTQ